MRIKKILIVTLLCLMISVVSACSVDSNTNEKEEKSLTFLSNFPIDTLDPHLSYTPVRAGIN